jgi:hypothetical protein
MSMRIRLGALAVALPLLAALPVTPAPASPTCALPDHPTPSCAGVPAGTAFTRTIAGDYYATTNGEVIDAWHITGSLVIKASGVVVTRTQVDDVVDNEVAPGSSFTISDSTVGTATCVTGGWPSVDGHHFTATRVLLQGHQDGVDVVGDDVTIADSLLKPCYLPPEVVGSDGYHSDGVQDQCAAACSNLIMRHNTVDARASYDGVSTGNAALNLGSAADGLMMRAVTLENNMFLGGGFTTDLRWDAGVKWKVTGNVWVAGSWTYGPISTEDTCSHQTWSGNSIVTADAAYHITGTVGTTGCVD